MKRLISIVLVCLMIMALAACGNTSDKPATGTTPDTTQTPTGKGTVTDRGYTIPDEDVTIRFSWWGGDERAEATLAVIDQFMKMYPNVTIEGEYGSSDGYHDKLSTQLASGTAADIVQVDPETFPTYIGGDYFHDFKDFGFDLSNFDESYIGLSINGRYDGKQLGLPTGISGVGLLYNKDLAEEIGIDFTQDYTWEDLIEWGRKVREYDDSLYLLCMNKDYITNVVVYTYLKQKMGDTMFNMNERTINLQNEDLLEVLNLVKALYDNEVIPPASYMAAYSGDDMQSDPNWIAGKYVACFTYVSTIDVMVAAAPDQNYAMGNLAVMKDAKNTGWQSNTPQVLAITKTSKYPEVCAAFLDYFFNNETAMETLACTRSVPPTAKAREVCERTGTLSTLAMDGANITSKMAGLVNDGISSSQEGKAIIAEAVEKIGYAAGTPEDIAASTYSLLKGLVD
ncbi:MAG: extracellular solute-binding protein [Clostridiaceae bacterium]|nr:extracellular solute-binding protein [Clostridiaceae bacterium]